MIKLDLCSILGGMQQLIDRHQKQKRKRNKKYDQTRSVFYIRWDATMLFLIIHRIKTTFSNCKTILSISMHRNKKNIPRAFRCSYCM